MPEADLNTRLARDGYAVVENFLSPSEVAHLVDVFRSFDDPTQHGGWNASTFSSDVEYRAKIDRAMKEVLTPHAAELLPGYRICFCNFLVKEPRQSDNDGVLQIHQDPSFVDEERWNSLGLWVPLVDTDLLHGGLIILRGSHRWNNGPRSFGGSPTPYRHLLPAFLEHARPLTIKAGSALVFSQKTFHGSPTNRGQVARITAAVLLVPEEAPLRCYYANPDLPGKLEVFAVEDLFYTRYPYATRPAGVPLIGVVDLWHDPIRPEQVSASSQREHAARE